MTDNNHPITPPPELMREWINNDDFPFSTGTFDLVSITKDRLRSIATQAAHWGADQELEACRTWVEDNFGPEFAEHLRLFRRPKPLSLKELNLKHLDVMERDGHYLPEIIADLRRAIESLPD